MNLNQPTLGVDTEAMEPAKDHPMDEATTRLVNDETRHLGEMIRDIDPARPSTITRRVSYSSLGDLDCLPAEILVMTLDYLDFNSLSRLSQTSVRAKEVVEGRRDYQDMMRHAPETLAALGRTGLLFYHPARLLQQTLRSKQCVSCYDFGGFLLLPTCERVCFECLDRNSALRVMKVNDAKVVFGLKDRHLREVPIMKNIPNHYGIRYRTSKARVFRLVNVKQAKQRAIQVHGSSEALEKFAPNGPIRNSTKRGLMLRALNMAPLEPPGGDMSKTYRQIDQQDDEFGGVASIRFPFVSSAGADKGRLCRGCEITFEHYRHGLLPVSVSKALSEPLSLPHEPLRAAMSRLRTMDDFLEHTRGCYGVRRLLAGEEIGQRYN